LHNQHVSQIRRAAREGTTIEWTECAPALTCAPHQIGRLELRELEQAIRLLPEEQRRAVLLVGLTRANYDEIAVAYGVPIGTIRSRLSRGRATLRKLTGVSPPQRHISAECKAPAKRSTEAKLPNPTHDAQL
jgi:RNA polymerase sigma-70 factor (ECF subfamily)